MYKVKSKKIFSHSRFFFFLKSRELKGGLDHRDGIPNHGLAALLLKLNTCLQSYNHPLQPEEVEGAQAECQLYN